MPNLGKFPLGLPVTDTETAVTEDIGNVMPNFTLLSCWRHLLCDVK